MSKQYPGGLISKTPVTPSGPYNIDTASGVWTLEQQAYWQRLGQWPTAGNSPTDPQFNYVTMLLHGDGTNGAQNNTFLDSSPNTYTMTRSGLATQGSFSPYGSNWSNYFNGSTDYLTAPSNAVFAFGTGDFTIEFWISSNKTAQFFIDIRGASASANPHITTGGASENKLRWGATNLIGATTIIDGRWHHCAVTRQSGTIKLWVDGVQDASGSDTGNFSQQPVYIGQNSYGTGAEFGGYMSNLRIVKGTAVYTATFTPSTTPLTAITDTALLTCQSNRFRDNSTNAFAVSFAGTPSVQRFNPFGASAPYSTSVTGGSAYFNGSSSIAGPNSTQLDFSTNNFTIEFWLYYIGGEDVTGTFTGGTSGRCYQIFVNGNQVRIRLTSTGGQFWNYGVAGTLAPNTWNHVALCRSGSTFRTFLNGVAGDTTTNADPMNTYTGNIQIGRSQYYVIGYIADYRIVNGTALYTSAFTPPTSPLTAVTNTALLNNFTNAGIYDNAMMNDLETVGNAQISTSVKKYGTGSLAFDGTGDYLASNSAGTNVSYAFGTGAFTIELWLYLNTVSGGPYFIYDGRPLTTQGAYPCLFMDNATLTYQVNSGDLFYATLATGTWYHIAVCRSGTTNKLFVNGTQQGSATDATNYLSGGAGRPGIGGGGYATDNYFLNGYIDDLRITKGYARYTANFTPPTAALFDFSPT
jgi:hypothetical protein